MEIERRERDPDTGELVGAGWGDMFGKLAEKLTGKTASKLASKAAEKIVEKGAEKVGEKTGQLLGEKIYDKFSTKETKGKEIAEFLKKESSPKGKVSNGPDPRGPGASSRHGDPFQSIKDVYEDLL